MLPKGLLHLQELEAQQQQQEQEKAPPQEEEMKGGGGNRKYSRSTSFHSIQECLEMHEGEHQRRRGREGGRVGLRENLEMLRRVE